MIVDLHTENNLLSRERDFKLAFTSGCYDLIHSGHIHFLSKMQEAASKKQAKTLVALHGDQAIRENKGKDRPILEAKERLEVIDSIKFTDYVGIWQGWASIVDLVRDLRPKFLVVNAHALVEADWQDNWHTIAEEIEAEIISIEPLANTNSTSRIIEKIRQ